MRVPHKDEKKRKKYQHQYYLDHRKEQLEDQRQDRKDNPKKYQEHDKRKYLNNREEIRERARKSYENNPEKNRERAIRWNKNNPEAVKRRNLKRYDLSYENWLRMWEEQDGKCAICEKPFNKPSNACVDHNHKTGEIRGLLCNRCNYGLGFFNDNQKLIIRAIKYLAGNI